MKKLSVGLLLVAMYIAPIHASQMDVSFKETEAKINASPMNISWLSRTLKRAEKSIKKRIDKALDKGVNFSFNFRF